jgi:F-type H+-transporting ATPase subunit delta
MNEGKISVRYAKALFLSAVEKKLLENVYRDMLFIAEVCKLGQLREVLDSPIIFPSKKKKILHGILEKEVEGITMSLIDLLVLNGRESFLPAVARVFRDDTLRYRGITETYLTTAVPVNDRIKKQITELVSSVFKTKVELKETVDKEIIGGFILKVDDNYIDASVRNKLRKISKGLSARTIKSE